MIPKIIHYCWFGKKNKPKIILDCIATWKNILPNYEIIEWNESNCEINNKFALEAYNQKKWAFVADYIRLEKLYLFGGVYLDTDMLLLKNLDSLLDNEVFFGYEEENIISAGIIGAKKGNKFIEELLHFYNHYTISSRTNFYEISIPIIISNVYRSTEYSNCLIKIYPIDFFYPLPNVNKLDAKNYLNYVTKNTFAIHLWNASWVEYDEFYYLRNKIYLKSFYLIFKRIICLKEINLYYFKRIYNNFILSIK